MTNRGWLSLVLACGVGIGGLLLAADSQGTGYWLGFALFVAAIIYIGLVIKRYFDLIERQRR